MSKTLTIDLDEYETITKARARAENEIVELKKQLVSAKLGDTDDLAWAVISAFRHAVEIVKYAEGLLSPEFARKWPRENLLAVADGLELLPDATVYELEHAAEMRSFARDISKWDAGRNERYVPPPLRENDEQHPVVISRATGDVPQHVGGAVKDPG